MFISNRPDLSHRKRVEIALLIVFLRSMQVSGPFIIVAPLSLVSLWVKTFNLYTDMPVSCLTGTEEERKLMYSGRLNSSLRRRTDFPVIITSYEVAITDSEQLNELAKFTHFIVEEGEGFERYRCELLSSLNYNRTDNRLFLPASPIICAKDMLSVLSFLVPRDEAWFDDAGFLPLLKSVDECNDEERRHQIEAKLQTILRAFTVHGE